MFFFDRPQPLLSILPKILPDRKYPSCHAQTCHERNSLQLPFRLNSITCAKGILQDICRLSQAGIYLLKVQVRPEGDLTSIFHPWGETDGRELGSRVQILEK
ncbi:hypothetical protein ASE23_17120 [Rhizobium sp. Root73]|nr:hypothetical protein ASE23_17120 [Rhizobium sp. Root73]